MEYMKATKDCLDQVLNIVQKTIRTVYPKYYPSEVVDFFCQLHCKENIASDIEAGCVGILSVDGNVIGTGCYKDNHITRVYVLPPYQKKGYGSYIMQCLENEISATHNSVYLDASLPASHLYESRGYRTLKHEKWNVENGVVLIYDIMEKELNRFNEINRICYEGKIFVSKENTDNGEVGAQTLFRYHQKGDMVWADYEGGDIVKGHLVGSRTASGELDFYYHHYNVSGNVRVGMCHSIPEVLDNGKLKLIEEWQWLNGDESKGKSILEEK